MESSGLKTMAVAGIVLGCFATFFPRVITPLFMSIVRRGDSDSLKAEQYAAFYPEGAMHASNPGLSFHQRKMGVHPGMHAASEMRKYMEGRNKGSPAQGSSVLSVVLPLYAMAIAIYLLYTLAKLFSRRSEKKGKKEKEGCYVDVDENRSMKAQMAKKQQQLEKLLMKAEMECIDEDEMVLLRRRLASTEEQMNRLLTALDHIQLNHLSSLQQNNSSEAVGSCSDEEEDDEDEEEDEDEDEDECSDSDTPTGVPRNRHDVMTSCPTDEKLFHADVTRQDVNMQEVWNNVTIADANTHNNNNNSSNKTSDVNSNINNKLCDADTGERREQGVRRRMKRRKRSMER